jgi:hypothetical protein
MKELIVACAGVVNAVTVVVLAIIASRYAASARRQAVAAESLVGVAEAQQKAAEFQAKAAQEQSRASSAQACCRPKINRIRLAASRRGASSRTECCSCRNAESNERDRVLEEHKRHSFGPNSSSLR